MSLDSTIRNCDCCVSIDSNLLKPPACYIGKNYQGVLIVGESPHKNWKTTGSPFGDSGRGGSPSSQRLEEYLVMLGVSVADIALTEVVKCEVNDRRKLAAMMANCSHFLGDQFKILKPKVIISIGQKTAEAIAELFGADLKMLEFTTQRNMRILTLYHPSPINPRNHLRNVNFLKSVIL